MKELHVVFGTGPLGRSIMSELLQRGKAVRMINRSGQMPSLPVGGVEVVGANVYNLERLETVTQGAAVVYNAVAPAYSGKVWESELPKMWDNILHATAKAGAKLVIGDNLYMYDQTPGPIREDRPMQSNTRKGQARIQAVEAMLQAHQRGDVQVTFGRGSDFFGPYATDSSHLGSRVFPALLKGKAVQVIHRLDVPHTLTYINDFGRALVALGAHEKSFGQVWHVPNAPTQTFGEVLQLAAKLANKPLKIQALQPWMIRALGLFVPILKEVDEMLYQYQKPYTVDSSKFEKAFGIQATPFEESLKKTIEYFSDSGSSKNPATGVQ